jgi:hypothetical protein
MRYVNVSITVGNFCSSIGRDSLLEEFDEQIFNALVEKIEILTPTHYVFELKSGLRVEEILE